MMHGTLNIKRDLLLADGAIFLTVTTPTIFDLT